MIKIEPIKLSVLVAKNMSELQICEYEKIKLKEESVEKKIFFNEVN